MCQNNDNKNTTPSTDPSLEIHSIQSPIKTTNVTPPPKPKEK